jgi:inositol-hexakisphosphate/diphosphoinositol-pentakisphosphate 1-kinase
MHNPELINEGRLELMQISQMMCRLIVPFEYGTTTAEKIEVGLKIIHPLLKKVHDDLLWWLTPNKVRPD